MKHAITQNEIKKTRWVHGPLKYSQIMHRTWTDAKADVSPTRDHQLRVRVEILVDQVGINARRQHSRGQDGLVKRSHDVRMNLQISNN